MIRSKELTALVSNKITFNALIKLISDLAFTLNTQLHTLVKRPCLLNNQNKLVRVHFVLNNMCKTVFNN